jgi:cytochrome c553
MHASGSTTLFVAGMFGLAIAPCPALAQDALTPAFATLDSMEARVQGCVTCHARQGQGTADGRFPRIAGKPAGYLYNQLVAFRDGTRSYPPMNYLVAYLPDAYLRDMAEHFARQRPAAAAAPPPPDRAVAERGQAIAQRGDPARGVPACVACHGQALTGMEPGIPGLAGLAPAYVIGQLTRWRVGERKAAEPDCMKRIATRLSDADVAAVAGWLASQPLQAGAAPEPSQPVRMPLACGSQR